MTAKHGGWEDGSFRLGRLDSAVAGLARATYADQIRFVVETRDMLLQSFGADVVDLVLRETVAPNVCPTCRGAHSSEERRPNSPVCSTCGGTGHTKPSVALRCVILGISRWRYYTHERKRIRAVESAVSAMLGALWGV